MNYHGRLKWIVHNEHSVLKIDMSQMEPEALMEFIDYAVAYVVKLNMRNMLMLYDVSDTKLSAQNINKLKFVTRQYGYLRKRSAVMGLNGPRRIIFNGIMVYTESKMKAFTDEEEAIRYLCED